MGARTRFLLRAMIAVLVMGHLPAQAQVSVTVDPSKTVGVSKMRIGITPTHEDLDTLKGRNDRAVERAKKHLVNGNINLFNVHIMGWGGGNPCPKLGRYEFASLDRRMAFYRSMKGEIVITFCTAPGWMKPSGQDWKMNDKVARKHWQAFAELCVRIAKRYPDVKHFQIWNELKGWWKNGIKEYTNFHNTVYVALKKARPDARIAGPYMNGLPELSQNNGIMSKSTHKAYDSFLSGYKGAEIINYDGWLAGYDPKRTKQWTLRQLMANTDCFANHTRELRKKVKARTGKDLPIWVSEYYCALEDHSDDPAFIAANYASSYYHSLLAGTEVILQWGTITFGSLFTSIKTEAGGEPLPKYHVIRAFNTWFKPGTKLVRAESSDATKLEVLASPQKVMLINKTGKTLNLALNGKRHRLEAYQVSVLDTPK